MNSQVIKNIRKWVRLKMMDDRMTHTQGKEDELVKVMKKVYNGAPTNIREMYRRDMEQRIKIAEIEANT